jgi:YHS domain-containing protein
MTYNEIDFHLKKGDTADNLVTAVTDSDGIVDLSNAEKVSFKMVHISTGTKVIDEEAEFFDRKNGEVVYFWNEEDTQKVGKHHAEFVIERQTGELQSFPNDEYILVYIEDRAI